MSPEHENTNISPIVPEFMQEHEPQVAHAQEEAVALGGISRIIASFKLSRAETKLDKLISNDHIIKHTTVEAQKTRGFGSAPVKPEDNPESFGQRRAQRHRTRQVEKRRKHQRERYRLAQVYGDADLGGVDSTNTGRLNSAPERANENQKQPKATRAQRRYTYSGRYINNIDENLQRGLQGDTYYAKFRERRIKAKTKKINKLRTKLGNS